MQCGICHRSASIWLPFHCILCSRDALYHQRIQLAQTLLEKEGLGKEVERATVGTPNSNKLAPPRASKSSKQQIHPTWAIECAASDQALTEERKESILYHNKTLREEIQTIKDDLAKRKTRFRQRRLEFTSAKQELLQSQASGAEPIGKSTRRLEQRWDQMHNKSAEARLFLGREAALLYGLHQEKRRKGGLGRDIYSIAGIPIPDLRDLNNASPNQVTTSTTNLAHLVHLVSHYLSLRLPAEITLPHRDYPYPTIFSPSSSYTGRDAPSPGSTPSHSSNNSPSASRHAEQRSLPRPRPLNLTKKLSALAKDDLIAYSSFVEGITFLAWDVAWLCKTQGMNVGDNSWEDVCAIGKNLWQLLLAPLTRPPLSREASSKSSPQKPTTSQSPNVRARIPTPGATKGPPFPGDFSHGTAYGFLAAAAGSEHMRSWRLQSPVKVIDKVKTMLQAERTGAEWEILEGNEWEVEDNGPDVKGEPNIVNRLGIEETGVLVRPEAQEGPEGKRAGDGRQDEGEGKEKSTSGWMKLKNRQP